MTILLKKTAILTQVILAMSLPFFVRVAAAGVEPPELKLTPYAIGLIQGKLRESTEDKSPLANRDFLRQELQRYCQEHHLPFDVSDSIR